MHRYPVFPTGVLLLGFFDLFKVSKINMTCSKSVVGNGATQETFFKVLICNFQVSKICKKGYIEMTKKIYLETLKKCLGSLCFPLLLGRIFSTQTLKSSPTSCFGLFFFCCFFSVFLAKETEKYRCLLLTFYLKFYL